jgi:hypothetical protein
VHRLLVTPGFDGKPNANHVRAKIRKLTYTAVGVSRPGGSLGRRVKCRRVPQPRWVGARRSAKGGRRQPEREREREVEIPRPSCLSRVRVGCACSRGLQASTREGSERPHASACPALFPARPTFCKRALVLPFIGVRRGSRCTMGGVAEC